MSKTETNENRKKLLALLLREQGLISSSQGDEKHSGGASQLPQRPKDGVIPLSFAQEGLWFLDQFMPEKATYNVPFAFQLAGRVDAEALEQSLQMLLQRHEILRSALVSPQGHPPIQHILPALSLPLPVHDLRDLPPAHQQEHLATLSQQMAHTPFDLAHPPLLRVALLLLGEQEARLLLTLHHCIIDGSSLPILLREWGVLYYAALTGTPASLPLPAWHYADYALWEREQMARPEAQEHLAFWRTSLAGAPPLLPLPLDHARPARQRYHGRLLPFQLSPQLSHALRTLSQQEGGTLFQTLYAAFVLFLSRYSQQRDIVVGVPVAQRDDPRWQQMIGLLTNTLVLRQRLEPRCSFRDLLQQVRQQFQEVLAHAHVPFERLVQSLNPERDPGYHPIYQVNFMLESASTPTFMLDTVVATPLQVELRHAKLDLALSMQEDGTCLSGAFEYCSDLFEEGTIQSMILSWQTLLQNIVAFPERNIFELPLTAHFSRTRTLPVANAPTPTSVWDVYSLFAQQAGQTPDAIAVCIDDNQFTYQVLAQASEQLAQFLQRAGIASETHVGVYMDRSFELIVAIFGILRVGAVYVPLDVIQPEERLAFLLEDASVTHLLTQPQYLQRIPSQAAAHPIFITAESIQTLLSSEADSAPHIPIFAEQAAYVIYTSGSTGRPKGVIAEHRNLCHVIEAIIHDTGMNRGQRTLQLSALNFDGSLHEIFATLLAGATLVLGQPQDLVPGELLHTLLQVQAISVLAIPPSLLAVLPSHNLPVLQTLITIGEAPTAGLYQQWGGERTLINGYGPAECTISASFSHWQEGKSPRIIGLGLSGTQLYVLDRSLSPVPPGAVGELYIGGVGVTRGYWQRPDLTAERFLPDPWSSEPGNRMYRTGDFVRLLPSGELEFARRADDQIKVRGIRIEPGEIESILCEHELIRDAKVFPNEDQMLLHAFVLPSAQGQPNEAELRQWLEKRLPRYMQPNTIVCLSSFPVGSNGKLDKETMFKQLAQTPRAGDKAILPSTPMEKLVARTWSQVLHIQEEIDVRESFFALGGHSLLVAQVISLLRTQTNVPLSLQQFFAAPTIEELTRVLEQASREQDFGQTTQEAGPARRPATLPLSFAQERLWFLQQLDPATDAYNIAMAWEIFGRVDAEALEQSLQMLLQRHEILRSALVSPQGHPLSGLCWRMTCRVEWYNGEKSSEEQQRKEETNVHVRKRTGKHSRRNCPCGTCRLSKRHPGDALT